MGSSKPFHQSRNSADCSVTLLAGGAAAFDADGCRSVMAGFAVARTDQCAGACAVGRTKSGPTAQAASNAIEAIDRAAGARLRFIVHGDHCIRLLNIHAAAVSVNAASSAKGHRSDPSKSRPAPSRYTRLVMSMA